jgi:hypothetical protein
MGKENSIRTNTNVSSKLIGSGTGFSSYNLNQKTPKSIYAYAIVTFVNSVTKTITYNIIEDNLGINKTGTAIPLYPNKITMPTSGSVVPLLRGPDTNIGSNAGQYSKTIYYLDPIGIQQTVNGNIIVKKPSSIVNSPDLNNIRNATIGIAKNSPNNKNSPSSTSGYKALVPNVSSIKDSELDIVKGPFSTNTGIVQELAVVDTKPVGINVAKAIILMKRAAMKDGVTLIVRSGFRSPNDPINKISSKGTPVNADSQKLLYDQYVADPKNRAYTKAPGTSNHGNAFAFDLNTGSITGKVNQPSLNKKVYQWLVSNAYKFGFVRWEPEEEWHWEYRPGEYQYNSKVPKNNVITINGKTFNLYTGINT